MMLKTSRRASQPRAKYAPRQVIATKNQNVIEAFYQATGADAPLAPPQCALGIIQHPATDLYQVWLSTNGLDVICVSAHRRMMRADMVQQELERFLQSEDWYQKEKAAAFFAQLQEESDEDPRQLPDDLVRAITRGILRSLVDHP